MPLNSISKEQVVAFLLELRPAVLDPNHVKENEAILEGYFKNVDKPGVADLLAAARGACKPLLYWQVEPVEVEPETPKMLTEKEAHELLGKRQTEIERKEAARILKEKIENSQGEAAFLQKMADSHKKDAEAKAKTSKDADVKARLESAINGVEVVREINGRSLMDYSRTDAIRKELRRIQVKGVDRSVDHAQTLAIVLRVISKINNQTMPGEIVEAGPNSLHDAVLADIARETQANKPRTVYNSFGKPIARVGGR